MLRRRLVSQETQRQRIQAEGLIERMPGNLRPKLAPAGRHDVLDAVGGKAPSDGCPSAKDRLESINAPAPRSHWREACCPAPRVHDLVTLLCC